MVLANLEETTLVSHLHRLMDEQRIERFLQRLEDYAETAAEEVVEPLLVGLFQIPDELPRKGPMLLGVSPGMQVARVALRLIRQVKEQDRRKAILLRIVRISKSLTAVIHNLAMFEPEEGKENHMAQELEEGTFSELRQAVLERIHAAAEAGELRAYPDLWMTLYRWKDWAGPTEPRAYVARLVSNDEGLLSFLEGIATTIASSSSYTVQRRTTVRRKYVEDFSHVDVLLEPARRILAIEPNQLTARQIAVLQAFLNPTDEWGDTLDPEPART